MADSRKNFQGGQGQRGDQGQQGQQDKEFTVSEQDLKIILDGNSKKLVETAEEIAKNITSVTTSQIRNIFGTVKSLESRGAVTDAVIAKLMLLKPKLAYAAGRHKTQGMKNLKTILSKAIDLVYDKGAARFDNFCSFFEAILAYHKAHGGK